MSSIKQIKSSLTQQIRKQKTIFLGDLDNMVIREKYEDELNSLINDLFVLGKEVYFMIEQSISVLSDEDRNNARNLIKYDKKLTKWNMKLMKK